jgi:hypothetical protein
MNQQQAVVPLPVLLSAYPATNSSSSSSRDAMIQVMVLQTLLPEPHRQHRALLQRQRCFKLQHHKQQQHQRQQQQQQQQQ